MDYCHYLIAFLDVLGQRQRLRELRDLPTTNAELERTLEILRDTAGVVLFLREAFDRIFHEYAKPAGLIDTIPPDRQQIAQELVRSKVEYSGFSDSLIIAIQLANQDSHCTPMNGVYACLCGVATVFTILLAAGHPVRGGIDVGLGLRLPTGEVYGPALERAYSLESSVAGHPRVVVGEELWTYLCEVATQPTSTPHAKMASRTAKECQRFIVQDVDAVRLLDYMGDAFQESVPNGIAADVERAYKFVNAQCRYWRAKQDATLSERYDRVCAYMEPRLKNWGLQPQQV